MTDMKATVRQALAGRLLADVVKEETDAAKVTARELMQDFGAERVRVNDETGTDMGSVTLAKGRVTARVTDPKAYAAWVARKYPDEVETVQVVRPAFERRLLTAAAAAGDPVDGVAADGELIPGVEVVAGEPYVTVRPTDAARERMRSLVAASGLLQLTAGPGEVPGDAPEA